MSSKSRSSYGQRMVNKRRLMITPDNVPFFTVINKHGITRRMESTAAGDLNDKVFPMREMTAKERSHERAQQVIEGQMERMNLRARERAG